MAAVGEMCFGAASSAWAGVRGGLCWHLCAFAAGDPKGGLLNEVAVN